MTDTSKEAVEKLAAALDKYVALIGPRAVSAEAQTLRALLSERDTAFNAGIEAAAKECEAYSRHIESMHDNNRAQHAGGAVIGALACADRIRALAK